MPGLCRGSQRAPGGVAAAAVYSGGGMARRADAPATATCYSSPGTITTLPVAEREASAFSASGTWASE